MADLATELAPLGSRDFFPDVPVIESLMRRKRGRLKTRYFTYIGTIDNTQNLPKLEKLEDAASSTEFQLQFKPKITKIGSGSQEIWRVKEFDTYERNQR